MEKFQEFMFVFFGALTAAAVGIGFWLYKKQKENDR